MVIRKVLVMIEIDEENLSAITLAKQINIFEALNLIKDSWSLITPTTIINCFKKAGFSLNGDMKLQKRI